LHKNDKWSEIITNLQFKADTFLQQEFINFGRFSVPTGLNFFVIASNQIPFAC